MQISIEHKIFYGFLFTSVCFLVIGIMTTTYSDTVLLNSKPIGILQAFAGLIGVLHCFKWVNNARVVSYIVQISMMFRICSYITEIFHIGYKPGLLVGALIWTLIWAGYLVVNKLIEQSLGLSNTNDGMRQVSQDEQVQVDARELRTITDREENE